MFELCIDRKQKNNYFTSEKEKGTCMMKYALTARVQLPPRYFSSQSAASNEELLFKKCEKPTTYCRAKYWSKESQYSCMFTFFS
jgi:hypothetical protein